MENHRLLTCINEFVKKERLMSLDTTVIKNVLAPLGHLRVAINLGNPVLAQRDSSGEFKGVSVDLARALAVELELPAKLVAFDAAGKVFEALEEGQWDLAFLAIEPVRAEKIAFSKPYVVIEGTYLVKSDSRFHSAADLDKTGITIAVGKGAAYDLYLSRTLGEASLLRAPTSADAVEVFLAKGLDAAAGVRQPLEQIAANRDDVRVLPDSFTQIRQAMAVPIQRSLAAGYVEEFIQRQLSNGFVARSLRQSGQGDVQVPAH
jgi:polar amino acid transport system substrate-binding protein